MADGNALQVAWYVLIGILLAGYSILDGFDLGIGALFPFLARTREERDILAGAVGPVWDGNEVWLLTGGGALFAAFPSAYATVFSGFYLALMLVLFALIFRAVALEFRSHAPGGRRFWDQAFFAGSALPALLFGVAVGNLVQGVPLDASGEYAGTFFTLLRPFPLAVGVLGLVAFLLHGAAYAAVKTDGELRSRARKLAGALWPAYLVLLALSGIAAGLAAPGVLGRPLGWVAATGVLAALLVLRIALTRGKDGLVLLASSSAFLGLWGIVGSDMFPDLVRASNDPSLSLTLGNASSSPLTLKVMLIIALIGMPLVVGYTAYAYRVFKGKARPGY